MVTDPLADLLIRIKNAGLALKPTASCPYSKHKFAIAEKLKQVGYLKSVTVRGRKARKNLELELAYQGKKPKIKNVVRVSKPGRRVYEGVSQIKPVRQGFGLAIYSTPQGILTDKEARQARAGGELLFKIY